MVGDQSVIKEQGGAKEVSLIEKQMNGLVGVVGEAARILPTLDIKRGIGEMTVPHMTEGVRDQIKMDLGFGSGEKGEMVIQSFEKGDSLTVFRGPKDEGGGIDWKKEVFMQAGYKKDGDIVPDGLRVSMKLQEGIESCELFINSDGQLDSVTIGEDYRRDNPDEEIGQTQEEQKLWLSHKLDLVLNKGENGFIKPIDIKRTLEKFINDDELAGRVVGTELKAPKLVLKS